MDRLGSLGRLCIALSIVTALAVIGAQIGDHRHITDHASSIAALACAGSTSEAHAFCIQHRAGYYVSKAAVRELALSFLAALLPVVIWLAVRLLPFEPRKEQG